MKLPAEYSCDPNNFKVTDQMIQNYKDLGYFLVRGFLSPAEVAKLKTAVEHERFTKHSYGLSDEDKHKAGLIMWKHPGNDVTGMLARCEKVVGTCEKVLGGEVYHYHTKLFTKEAKTGGKLIWHQDYGRVFFFLYWYKNGCLFPDLMTAFVPIDRCYKENGCLEILEGSHRCGRIQHNLQTSQTGADLERVEHLKAVCPHRVVEMDAGCGLNTSDTKRWALIPCYNLKSNNPVYEHHHPQYTPLEKVPNTAILECPDCDDLSEKQFNIPGEDKT
ncbi:hypothetical protein EGW08_000089, partial [Elysia chlorotica]